MCWYRCRILCRNPNCNSVVKPPGPVSLTANPETGQACPDGCDKRKPSRSASKAKYIITPSRTSPDYFNIKLDEYCNNRCKGQRVEDARLAAFTTNTDRAKAKRDAEEKAKKDKEHAQRAAAVKEAVQKRNPPPQGSANPQASARPQHRQNRRLLPATSNTYPSLEPYPNPLFPRVNQGTTTFDGTHQSLPQDQPPARHPNADPLRSTTLPPPPPPPPSERPPQSRPFGRAPTWPDDVLNPSTPAPSSSQLAYRPARQPRAPTWPNDVLNPSTPAPSGPQLEHRPAPPPTTGGSGNSNTQGRTDRRRTRPRTDSPASTGNTPEPGTSQQQRGSGQPATKYQKKR